jgi:hypothetical protein
VRSEIRCQADPANAAFTVVENLAEASARKGALDVAATESDPIALQSFELLPEPVPSEVLGATPSMEVWALRLSGGSVREVLAGEPAGVLTREYVFALPLDVMGNLARTLTQAYEQRRGVL